MYIQAKFCKFAKPPISIRSSPSFLVTFSSDQQILWHYRNHSVLFRGGQKDGSKFQLIAFLILFDGNRSGVRGRIWLFCHHKPLSVADKSVGSRTVATGKLSAAIVAHVARSSRSRIDAFICNWKGLQSREIFEKKVDWVQGTVPWVEHLWLIDRTINLNGDLHYNRVQLFFRDRIFLLWWVWWLLE